MRSRKRIVIGALAAVLVLALAAAVWQGQTPDAATSAQTFGRLSSAQLAAMLANKDFVFINVHIPYEGEIEKTDAFIPFNEIEKHLGQLPADKSAPVVLYGRSGSMSSTAAEELLRRGFTNVSHLEGGMIAWQRAGYRLLDHQR